MMERDTEFLTLVLDAVEQQEARLLNWGWSTVISRL